MDTWSLPKTRPISCNDCPAFQRLHRSVLCVAESLTRLACVINTTFSEKIYIRWCCIDRMSRHRLSGGGYQKLAIPVRAVVSRAMEPNTIAPVWRTAFGPHVGFAPA